MKYNLYATAEHGHGHVQLIGTYTEIEEIEIRIGMFADDVVINIEVDNDYIKLKEKI